MSENVGTLKYDVNAQSRTRCTLESLANFRNTQFNPKFKKGDFAEAADLLEKYMNSSNCLNLVPSTSSKSQKSVQNLQSYLWAINDIAYARYKAKQYGDCIRITQSLLNEYYNNLIEETNSPKIKAAFQTNSKLCQSGRMLGLTLSQGAPGSCPIELKGLEILISGPFEDEGITKRKAFKISEVSSSYPIQEGCLSIVHALVKKSELEDSEEDATIKIPFLVKAEKHKDSTHLNVLDSFNSADNTNGLNCGDFKLVPYSSERNQTVFRVNGEFGFCQGGSAAGNYDSLWTTENGLTKRDEIKYFIH
jgi:hypothetical protein